MELPAFRTWSHDRWEVVNARWRIRQSIRRWRQSRGVAHRGAFDGGLRAIQERVKHFRIETANLRLLGRQAVVTPHRVGGGLGVMRQPLVPTPGGDDMEPGGAGAVHKM